MPKIAKSCLNLSKLRPKYYRSLFPEMVYSLHALSQEVLVLKKNYWQSKILAAPLVLDTEKA